MSHELTIFNNPEFGEVRVLEIDSEPWFVGKDVAIALGYSDITHTIIDHVDEDDRVNSKTQGQNAPEFGQRGTWLINESGLYSLVMSSKLESAKKFKRWITSEVLPSIRKHGAYMTSATIDKMIASPEFGIQLLTALKEEQDKRKELEGEVQVMQPKAEYFDELVDRNLLTNFRDTAKELHVKQKEFIDKLLELGFVYRDQKNKLQPYQQHVDKGLFELKECAGSNSKWCGTQTLITPKGRETFRLLFSNK